MTDTYIPLMLRPGWALEKYFGWTEHISDPGRIKLLRKRHGPLSKWLLMLNGVDQSEAALLLRDECPFGRLSAVLIVDLDGRAVSTWRDLGAPLLSVPSGRTFGVGTFYVDLDPLESTLHAQLGSRARRMCRRAERDGLRVQLNSSPSTQALADFRALFEPMAKERSLQVPSREVIERMSKGGNLLAATCFSASGEPLAANLMYIQHDTGFFLYGARAGRQVDGAAHYTHWKTELYLKGLGLRWYDLGQVPSTAEDDGLFIFKRELGGAYLSYGSELAWRPLPLRTADVISRWLSWS